MTKNNIGVIGLAVMGSNLALNIADHGFTVALYNRTTSVGEKFIAENPHENLHLYKELPDFVNALESPRKIILMVQAGVAVDRVIEQLIPLLDKGDILMDGGNSLYKDTIRRHQAISELGLRYLGTGISGGEEGARFGPAIMPGGDREAYQYMEPILTAISAKANDGQACSTYIGDNGAGHYVKMVHNGIEYADMQLIAESYALLKHVGGLNNQKLAQTFTSWNQGELESFLIEITADIFNTKDPESDHDLVDVILDRAAQKGTGKWTAEEALNTGTDASLLASSVFSRFMSSNKVGRIETAKIFPQESIKNNDIDQNFVEDVRKALYASKIIAYAQGFELLSNAAKDYNWDLNYGEIAKIFRAGCIIRAQFLNKITDAYTLNPTLKNLMLDPYFAKTLMDYQGSLRRVVGHAINHGISVSAFANAVSYFDAYRTVNSPANLIQAQRDYFGSHTFERTDKEGNYHFDWILEHGKK